MRSFTTGFTSLSGRDTGIEFEITQIETKLAALFADSHNNMFPPGF
jgi:hypothetical protein